MAVIIARFAKNKNYQLKASANKSTFADVSEINDYGKEAVAMIQAAEIISGKGNNMFSPKAKATRAEGSKMLALLIKAIAK